MRNSGSVTGAKETVAPNVGRPTWRRITLPGDNPFATAVRM